jgi:hypothetical protein
MRTIEKQMNQAIRERRNWRSGNTTVAACPGAGGCDVFLHGNHIANVGPGGTVIVNRATLRDWPTPTTKSRLRALGVNVTTKAGVTYVDGKEV